MARLGVAVTCTEADVSLVDLLTAGLAAEGLEADLAAGLVGEILALYAQEGQAAAEPEPGPEELVVMPSAEATPEPVPREPAPETYEPQSLQLQETPPMAKPTFHFVRHVRSSVQGGIDVDLAPKTFIVGPNASRKDAIIRAVTLGLTGRVHELGGKEVGQPVELLALAPGREGVLFSHVTLSDGQVASFRTRGVEGGGKSTGTVHEVPKNLAVLLGLSEVREVLTRKGDDERRKFFLGLMGADIPDDRLIATLGEPRRERFLALLTEARKTTPGLTGAAALTTVLALAKAEKAAATSEAKAADALLAKLMETAGIAPTAEQLLAAKIAAEEAAKGIEGRLTQPTRPVVVAPAPVRPTPPPAPTEQALSDADRAGLSAQIDEVRGYIAPTQARLDALVAELADNATSPEVQSALAQNAATRTRWEAVALLAREQLAGVERGNHHQCVLCAGHGVDGAGNPVQVRLYPDAARGQAEFMATTAGQWFAYLDQQDAELRNRAVPRRAELEQEIAKGRDYLASIETWLAEQTGRLTRDDAIRQAWAAWQATTAAQEAAYAQALAAYVPPTEAVVDPENAAAVQRWQALTKTYQDLQSAYDKAEATQRARSQRSRAQDAASLADRLVEECSEAVVTLLGQQRQEFVGAVQAHMPPPEKMPKGGLFDLRLTEGSRDVCQIGLIKDGVLHTALSGAEWVIVTTALAGVLATRYDCPIVIPEDRDIDPETLANAMRALTDAPCQILWGATKTPKGRTPAGWEVIEADKLEVAIPVDEPWVLPEEEAAKAAKAAAKAAKTAAKASKGESEPSPEDDDEDDEVGVSSRTPAEARQLAEVVDGFRAPDDAPGWWRTRGQHCGWRGVTDPNAKARGRGEPFGEAYVRIFGQAPVVKEYVDCTPLDEDGEPEPNKTHRLVLFDTGAVGRFWTPAVEPAEDGSLGPEPEAFSQGLLYRPADTPDWAQRCGPMHWTGPIAEARAAFVATFGSDPVARAQHDLRTGTWRQYSNGAVGYQSGATVTFYRGDWKAPAGASEGMGTAEGAGAPVPPANA